MFKCSSKLLYLYMFFYTCNNVTYSHNYLNSCRKFCKNGPYNNLRPYYFINRNKPISLSNKNNNFLNHYVTPFCKNDRFLSNLYSLSNKFEIKEVEIDKYRNIGIMAHVDAGKTTTTERILYLTGVTYKMGEVNDGQAEMDYLPQERERGITITSAATTCYWSGGYYRGPLHRINIIDTPGHIDFTVEVERSLRVLDGGIVVLDGEAGVEIQTETVWRQADRYKIPRIAYVNKMDRMGCDFEKCIEEMKEKLGANPIPLFIPVGSVSTFEGVVDVIRAKFYKFYNEKNSFKYEQLEIPKKMMESYEKYRDLLIGTVAQESDELLQKYFAQEPLTEKEIRAALRSLTLKNKVVPLACGSSLKNINIQGILDMVLDYLPSPCEVNKQFLDSIKSNESSESLEAIEVDDIEDLDQLEHNLENMGKDQGLQEDAVEHQQIQEIDHNKEKDDYFDVKDFSLPFASLVFKLAFDTGVGHQSIVRIYRGTIKVGDKVYNPRTKKTQRVQRILFVHSNTRKQIREAHAGDIVALAGIKAVTGDTLCSERDPIVLESIEFPEPVISLSVDVTNPDDNTRLNSILEKYMNEDPSFKFHTNQETGQTLVSGMGELHLEVALDRIKREHKLDLKTGDPQVAFKETFLTEVTAEGKFIKQTGGHGQYGHVIFNVVPLEQGSGIKFGSKIFGGAIPTQYIPYIEKALRDQLNTGLLANYPVTDAQITLVDGSFHEVDSSEFAFRMATVRAIKEAAKLSGMKLLEPIMRVRVMFPMSYVRGVLEDLRSRRGETKLLKDDKGSVKEIEAMVPLMEMSRYMTSLRSLTQGRGIYAMQMSHYASLPTRIQHKLVPPVTEEN